MSKIKNAVLDQYGTGPFKQQQFGTAGIEGVKIMSLQCKVFTVGLLYITVTLLDVIIADVVFVS